MSLHHQSRNLKRDVIQRLIVDPDPDAEPESRSAGTADKRDTMPRWLDKWMTNDESPLHNLDTLRGAVWHLSGAWARRHDPDVVLLHYSDLSHDLEAEMRRLAGRLGITVPEETWRQQNVHTLGHGSRLVRPSHHLAHPVN